jgi:ComF family protein
VLKALASVLALLYPQRCLGCTTLVTAGQHFCTGCLPFVRFLESPLCLCCGAPFAAPAGPDHLCGSCLTRPPTFHRARAWAYYQNGEATPQPIGKAIQQFKYHRNLSVGKALTVLAAAHCPLGDENYDVIIPVPLHIDRLRWRGFNQSLLLARALGRAQQIQVDPFLLERTRSTVPQTQLSERERRANVKGAFAVAFPEHLQGKRVLLVDDVYTSGATAEECAQALSRGGAQVVDVFTLARTVTH